MNGRGLRNLGPLIAEARVRSATNSSDDYIQQKIKGWGWFAWAIYYYLQCQQGTTYESDIHRYYYNM